MTGVGKEKVDDVQYFDQRSATYENSWEQWFFFDRIHKTLLNMIEKEYRPEVVLDVGCGTGRLLRKVKERWPSVQLIGVDAAAGMIENARKLMPYAIFYVSKAESLPLADASVDLAFSTASYHHWEDKKKALSEIRRVLRVGGRFFLADIWPPLGLGLGLSRFMPHSQSSNPASNPAIIRETFTSAGLQVQDQRRFLRLWLTITVGKHI
jgi:ubiquinone/menaquinone biosynthesis C-methylase UbiE